MAMKEHLIDREERLAALDTTTSHHVESPAGSGKTLLLTTRFLKLLSEVNHPREILALTFTEKAAGEMKNRIINYLTRAGRKSSPIDSLDKELLELGKKALEKHQDSTQIITSSNGLNIMTFHGFCNYVARRAPLEAGVAPDYEIIDEETQSLLMNEVIENYFRSSFSYPEGSMERISLENRLLHYNNNWKGLDNELRELIGKRDRVRDLTVFVREAGGRGLSNIPEILKERMRPYIEECLEDLRRIFTSCDPGMRWKDFVCHLEEKGATIAAMMPLSVPEPLWEELSSWQEIGEILLTRSGTPRRSLGPKRGFYGNFGKTEWGKSISDMDEDVAKRLYETMSYPSFHDTGSDVETLSDFIIVAADVIERYESLCRKRHLTDFVGLEQAALRVLDENNPSDLHLFLDHRIQHLLIDEFQDTSRIQWTLIKRLCDGWVPGDGRTVFIVGDPKQSIYAFRNAEVALFQEAKSGIPLSGHGVLPLSIHTLKTNFRSSGRLIAWTNELFGKTVMADPRPEADEVSFSPSAPAGKKDDRSLLSLNLFADEDNERAREKEAKWLARRVRCAFDETGGEKSIAVLLFTRNRLTRYLSAFKEEGLPVQVQEGLSLVKRPEIGHLIQMTNLLAMPHDDLAWASLLRSPWCWFDITTLLGISKQSPESWRDKIRMSATRDPKLRDIVNATDGAFLRVGRDPLGKIVKKLWADLNGPAETARLFGMAGVANCHEFFHVLEDMEEGIPLETLKRFRGAMERLYEPADPTLSRSSVQMMTIHRAKGLEFDIVFLPYLDWKPIISGPPVPPPYLLERIPGGGGKNVIAMGGDRRRGVASKTYDFLKKIKKERRWGEAKRWFYVASTRARDSLIMSGVAKIKDDIISAPDNSVLKWVMNHEGINDRDTAHIVEAENKMLSIYVNPEIGPSVRVTADHEPELPEPYELLPQRIPHRALPPSSFRSDEAEPRDAMERAESPSENAVIRGIVTHRMLSTYIKRALLPSEKAVAMTLVHEGMACEPADKMAGEILKEVGATVSEPFLSGLIRRSHPLVETEWPLEYLTEGGGIRSGIIDLAVFDGTTWWIVDFKTSRPAEGDNLEDFLQMEEKKYTPQIDHYRSMLKNLIHDDSQEIRAGIYLTALPLWREIKNI
jgi:ATP-dependent helicase/nuclease subunit A